MPEFDRNRLRAQRLARGLTADQTAHRAGRTVGSIHKYEAGSLTPSLATLCRLAEALDCPVETFFDPDIPANRHWLTDAEREAIRRQVDALPPLTDAQIEAVANVIIQSRIDRLEAAS